MLFVEESCSTANAFSSLINSADRSDLSSSGVDSTEANPSCPVRESGSMSSSVPLPTDLSLSESVSPNSSSVLSRQVSVVLPSSRCGHLSTAFSRLDQRVLRSNRGRAPAPGQNPLLLSQWIP